MNYQEIQEIPLFKDDNVVYLKYLEARKSFLEGIEDYEAKRENSDLSFSSSDQQINNMSRDEEIQGEKIASLILKEDMFHCQHREDLSSDDDQEYQGDINEDSDCSHQDIVQYRKKLWKGGVNIEEITSRDSKSFRQNQNSLRYSIHPGEDGEIKSTKQIGFSQRILKEEVAIDSTKKTIEDLLQDIKEASQQNSNTGSNLLKRRLKQSTIFFHLSKQTSLNPEGQTSPQYGKAGKLNSQHRSKFYQVQNINNNNNSSNINNNNTSNINNNNTLNNNNNNNLSRIESNKNMSNTELRSLTINTSENLSDFNKNEISPLKEQKLTNKFRACSSITYRENIEKVDQICSQQMNSSFEALIKSTQIKDPQQKRNPGFIRKPVHFKTSIIDANHKIGHLIQGEALQQRKELHSQTTLTEFEKKLDQENKVSQNALVSLNKIDENQEDIVESIQNNNQNDFNDPFDLSKNLIISNNKFQDEQEQKEEEEEEQEEMEGEEIEREEKEQEDDEEDEEQESNQSNNEDFLQKNKQSHQMQQIDEEQNLIAFTPHGTVQMKTTKNNIKIKDLQTNEDIFKKSGSHHCKAISNNTSPSCQKQKWSSTSFQLFQQKDIVKKERKCEEQQLPPLGNENQDVNKKIHNEIFPDKDQVISPIQKTQNLFQIPIVKQINGNNKTTQEEEKVDPVTPIITQKEPIDPTKLFKEIPLHVIESRFYLKHISYFKEENNNFNFNKVDDNSDQVLVMGNASSHNMKKLRVYFFGKKDIYLDFLLNMVNTRIGEFENYVLSSFLNKKQSNRDLLKWPGQPSHYRIFPSCGDSEEERYQPDSNIPELSEKMMLAEAIGEFTDYCCFVEVSDSFCESASVSNINEVDPEHELKEFQMVYSKQGELVFKVEWKEKEFSTILRIGQEKTVGDLFQVIQKKKTIDIDKKYFIILGKIFGIDSFISLDFNIPLSVLDGKILKIAKREYEDQQGSLRDDNKPINSQNNNFCSRLDTAEEEEESLNQNGDESSLSEKQSLQQDSGGNIIKRINMEQVSQSSRHQNNQLFQKKRGSKYLQVNRLQQIQLMKYEEFQVTKLYYCNNEVHKKSERIIGIDENSIYNRKVQSSRLNLKNIFCFLFPASANDTKNPVINICDVRDMYLIEDCRILIQFQERGQIKNWAFYNSNSQICKRIFQKLLFLRENQQVKLF